MIASTFHRFVLNFFFFLQDKWGISLLWIPASSWTLPAYTTFPGAGCIVPKKNELKIVIFHCPFFQDSKHSAPDTVKGAVYALVKRLTTWQQK